MGAQLQYRQDIEDRLWAVQVVKQVSLDVCGNNQQSAAYQRGCQQGLEVTLQKIEGLVTSKSAVKMIWVREEIRVLLLTIQVGLQQSFGEQIAYQQGFCQGGEAVLWAAATCFGVNLFSLSTEPKWSEDRAKTAPWFLTEDVQNTLMAMQATFVAIRVKREMIHPVEYEKGFEAALQHVAGVFGTGNLLSSLFSKSYPTTTYWFRQTVKGRLQKVYQIGLTPDSQNGELSEAQEQGFLAALHCVACSFGIKNLA